MSDLKISQLPELYYGEVQNGDYLPVVDISSGVTKKIRSDSFWMPVSDVVTEQAGIATNAKNDALAIKTEIRNWYYGPLATDPTTRPDGTAMQEGDEYHNSTDHVRKVYSSGSWIDVSLASLAGSTGAAKVGAVAAGGVGSTNVQVYLDSLNSNKASKAELAGTGGADLIGTEASPGGLWSTVRGFISTLLSGVGSSIIGYDDGTVQDVLDNAKPMANYTALRNYTGRATGVRITQVGLAGCFQRLSVDDPEYTALDNGGTIIVDASGRRWKRLFVGPLSVKWFGAKGDWNGTTGTDDTAAIQAAILAAKGSIGLYIPASLYKITSTLVIATNGANNLKIFGDNWRSRLVMTTDNTPIFKIAGMGVRICDIGIGFNNIQPVTNTDAIAIAPDYMYQCSFENIYCFKVHSFVYVRPITTTYNGASNLYFSCSFRDIYVQTYSGYGFYAIGYGGGVTGNSYDNIYINGQTPDRSGVPGTAIAAIALGAQDDSVFNQVNIEATNLTHAISIDGISSGVVFNSTHIEGITFTNDVLWLKNAYGIVFNGIVFRGNTLAANNKALMYVEGNVKVDVNGVYEFGTNTAGFTLHRYRSTLTYSGSSIKTTNVTSNTANVMASDSLYAKSILFEGVAKIGTPGYEIDIGERTDATQKSIRLNGNINGSGNFDGLVLGTLGTGAGNQIELISNTDINNSESWRIRSAGTGGIRIAYAAPTTTYSGLSYTEKFRLNNSGELTAAADNTQALGAAAYRWSVVYAGTGTINTSDEREKQQIRLLTDAERAVAMRLKSMIRAFKFNDAVSAKGDGARIHIGVIAQDVILAFEAEGLDPMKYAVVCYDEWSAEAEELGADGEVLTPAREAGSRYGVRYEELLAFMIASL